MTRSDTAADQSSDAAAVVVATATQPAPLRVKPVATHSEPETGDVRRWTRRLGVRFSPIAWLVASLFVAASVTPSLYPRPWLPQGVLSGFAAAVGLGVGTMINRPLRGVLAPRVPAIAADVARVALTLLAVAITSWMLLLNYRWQVDVRRMMSLDNAAALYLASTVLVATLSAYTLVLVARLLRGGLAAYWGLMSTTGSGQARVLVHGVVGLLAVGMVVQVAIVNEFVSAVNARLVAADASSEPEVDQPRSGLRSGSPASLASWDTLGRMGRRFVANAPTLGELRAFSETPARPPIRVYVGLDSASTVRARVELALAELERTRAFERDVLVVITPTGTGSVNPHAIAPVEYMYNGDTAAVAIQYSYLPSWMVMGGDQDRAWIAARALFDAIDRRLRRQPPGSRPLLLLYGESLGSFASERIFTDVADIRTHVDGVLWVGPTRANHLWRRLVAERDEGSPEWHPVYKNGETVRFATNGADLGQPGGRWTAPRIAYLQHPSDPVTWWTPDLLFERPEWMRDPRPPGISSRMPYVPVVTFVQTTIDTVLGGNAPAGFGHIYRTEHADAWAHIAPPRTWSPVDTTRLRTLLDDVMSSR